MQHSLIDLLSSRFARAVEKDFGNEVEVPSQLVLPATNPRFGDYQCAAPMALAKRLQRPPLELANELVASLDVADVCEKPEVAPPGFVNLRIRAEWLARRVIQMIGDDRLGNPPAAQPERIVVDYSGPNMAKEMHVGHLRSTIIGHCLANIVAFQAHDVERVNHVGDFGTQFGVLLAHIEDTHPEALEGHLDIADVEIFYREANARDKNDLSFAERSRQRVVDLQQGDPRVRAIWQVWIDLTRQANQEVYDRLDIADLVERGESSYESMLPVVVSDLESKGLLVVDQGAKVVFVEGFTNKEGDPLPLIVETSDGRYTYSTTDLAGVRHRVQEQGAKRVVYVVGAEQNQHLEMVFAVARRAGWAPADVELTHVPYGLVLGEDGKRLRTRAGDTPKLSNLLDEAVERAHAFVLERAEERGEQPPEDVERVSHVIGIGAVKYGDLAQNRTSNYIFSYDRMLSLKGNTAPYLQYAYARMRSILREAPDVRFDHVELGTEWEVELAKKLAQTGEVLDRVSVDYAPNHLCLHLYELSQVYNEFYENCPVLRSEEPLRSSRLAFCEATSRTLRVGLGLLGIDVLERL